VVSLGKIGSKELLRLSGRVGNAQCKKMLIDTGASACFIRRQWAQKQQLPITPLKKNVRVTLANNSKVQATEEVKVDRLTIMGSTAACTLLVLDDLPNEVIVGVDWLRAAQVSLTFGSPVQWCGQPIEEVKKTKEDEEKKRQVQLAIAVVTAKHKAQLKQILKRHEIVFSLELPAKSEEQLAKAVEFEITLIDPKQRAIKQRERRLSPAKAKAALEWVREEVAAGRMERSSSDWSSPLVIVPKHKDGEVVGYRVCGDYRALNEVTKADAEPLPLPEEIFDHLNGAEVFSKIDLLKGFYQIPVKKSSQPYLAVSTPDGLYHHKVMPFGVKNAPGAFQKEMRRIFRERLMRGVLVYI
jgi:gag-polyprotein putative aspartyl protease/Reverse transcriptase (RNA-dependent DNA polymerase)